MLGALASGPMVAAGATPGIARLVTVAAADGGWFAPPPLTLAFAGDTLWHSPLWRQAERNAAAVTPQVESFDFRPMLAPLAPYVAGVDLAVCHFETPIAPAGEPFTTHPDGYGVPPETATAVAAAGFDRCSTASNHTLDRGPAGIDRTIDVLADNSVAQSGMARTPTEIAPVVFDAGGYRVSHLSYTFSYNGLLMPAGEEWRSALIDRDRILADAAAARSAGAELVIVSIHWGVEGSHDVTGEQRQLAEALTASGHVDLIVGHHAHVLQPIEQINGKWVLFGLGSIISNLPTSDRWPAASQDAALVLTAARRTSAGIVIDRPVVVPTWVDRDNGWIVRPIPPLLADPATPDGLLSQLERSLERTRAVVGDYIPP